MHPSRAPLCLMPATCGITPAASRSRLQHLRALIHLFLRPLRHLAFPIIESARQRRSFCKLIARPTARDFYFSSSFHREEVSKLKLATIAIARHAGLTGDFCTCEVREISQNETLPRLIEVETVRL